MAYWVHCIIQKLDIFSIDKTSIHSEKLSEGVAIVESTSSSCILLYWCHHVPERAVSAAGYNIYHAAISSEPVATDETWDSLSAPIGIWLRPDRNTTETNGERCRWYRSSSAGATEGWSGRPCRRPLTGQAGSGRPGHHGRQLEGYPTASVSVAVEWPGRNPHSQPINCIEQV